MNLPSLNEKLVGASGLVMDFAGSFLLDGKTISIRKFGEEHLETLREWKNANRQYFLFQETISPEQQLSWYRTFIQNPLQQIFVCEMDGKLVACVGFRTQDRKSAEMFNLMIGENSFFGKGFGRSLYQFCVGKLKSMGFDRVFFKVMRTNLRAKESYVKWGFSFYDQDKDCDFMEMKI
jgi:N-acetylglutamate synthase-like GNAT family acetyltransferase